MQKQEFQVRLEELMPLFRQQLEAGNKVRFSPRGVSMLPMLRQGKDAVEFSPLPSQLQRYDLPLYRYPNGKYVLHRIVGWEDGVYICLGDNTYTYERVAPEHMIALVTAFSRGSRWISTQSPAYRLYCRVWCGCFPLRNFIRRGLGWLRRHLK